MLSRSLLLILLSLFSFKGSSQNTAHTLHFYIKANVTSPVYIISQFGVNSDMVDSATVSSNIVTFQWKNFPTGYYRIAFEYELNFNTEKFETDFVFHQQNIEMRIDLSNKDQSAIELSSSENKKWYHFKNTEKQNLEKLQQIFTAKEAFGDDEKLLKALKSKHKILSKEQEKYIHSILKNKEHSLTDLMILNLSQPITPFEFDADEIEFYGAKNRFERCTFDNEKLLYSNVYEDIIFVYLINQLKKNPDRNEQERLIMKTIDIIIAKTLTSLPVQSRLIDFIRTGLIQLEAEAALAYLHEKFPDDSKCKESEGLNFAGEALHIGDHLPEIFKSHLESKSDSENFLIFFWASWCPYSEMMRKSFIDLQISNQYETFVISLSENESFCESDRLLFMMENVHFICEKKGWNSSLAQKAGINSLPTLFVVNRDLKIIDIPENLSEIILKSH